MKKVLLVCLAICALSPALYKTSAQDTAAFTIELEPRLSGLSSPIFITHAGDGTNRLFIVEQGGRILVLQPGSTAPTEFLNIASKISSGGERGLLGLAFHPQFENNRRFFVNYTRSGDGATVIAEYRASQSNPNIANTAETPILTISQPFSNHNGGILAFGPDGFLYIGMGDGGSANDPGNRAQNVNELLGKILRIDIDQPNGQIPYSSPSNNPFFGPTTGRDEIFAVGLRNPWRFSFDRLTGELYAGDVGQNVIEEIDIITRGGNYGWRVFEGTRCANDPLLCPSMAQIAPIAEYSHTGGRCSITGGYVYRGSRSTMMLGSYIYGDFCTGEIFMLMNGAQTRLLDTSLSISSFGEDEAGEIYVVGIGGTVHHIKGPQDTEPPPPVINSAFVRRRSTGELLDPITTKNKGKKYEVVVRGTGFPPSAVIVSNGQELGTTGVIVGELIGRLKNSMLRNSGPLVIEVVASTIRSNSITLQIIDN